MICALTPPDAHGRDERQSRRLARRPGQEYQITRSRLRRIAMHRLGADHGHRPGLAAMGMIVSSRCIAGNTIRWVRSVIPPCVQPTRQHNPGSSRASGHGPQGRQGPRTAAARQHGPVRTGPYRRLEDALAVRSAMSASTPRSACGHTSCRQVSARQFTASHFAVRAPHASLQVSGAHPARTVSRRYHPRALQQGACAATP